MIAKWITLETDITPRILRLWADRLDADMNRATIGAEVPAIEIKDHTSKTIILLRADQAAWHTRNKGTFNSWT